MLETKAQVFYPMILIMVVQHYQLEKLQLALFEQVEKTQVVLKEQLDQQLMELMDHLHLTQMVHMIIPLILMLQKHLRQQKRQSITLLILFLMEQVRIQLNYK